MGGREVETDKTYISYLKEFKLINPDFFILVNSLHYLLKIIN